MMQMKCDKCGYVSTLSLDNATEGWIRISGAYSEYRDVCPECAKRIREWIEKGEKQ